MPEICVKSFAFQYEKQFIKEVKNYALPYNIYNNLVKEINEEPPLDISDYLINKSGSVIFRLKNGAGEKLDIEIKTIKTLGYYDTITNRHFDGDMDVRSM